MAVNQTRNVFFENIHRLMKDNENIVIVSVDLAGPPFDSIRVDFPDRYIAVGIAEMDAVSIACGIASTGMTVIVYAANPFPLFRAFDQIRNCACIMNIPIIIVGLGTGFSVAECGLTHLTIEDIAMASLCAGMEIYSISDNDMADFISKKIKSLERPTYIRLGKWSGKALGSFTDSVFAKGYRTVKEGAKYVVLATGDTTGLLVDMNLPEDYAIIDWFRINKNDGLIMELESFDGVIVVEEQQKRGGVGSILLEEFNDKGICKNIHRVGIDLEEGYPQEYGDRMYWLDKYNITREGILKISCAEGK